MVVVPPWRHRIGAHVDREAVQHHVDRRAQVSYVRLRLPPPVPVDPLPTLLLAPLPLYTLYPPPPLYTPPTPSFHLCGGPREYRQRVNPRHHLAQ